MRRVVPVVAVLLVAALAPLASIGPAAAPSVTVRLAPGAATAPIDGRLLLLISTEKTGEPRFQIEAGPKTQQVFGIDVDGWKPGETKTIDADVLGYPRASLRDVPAGEYRVQALLHRYETFTRADGHVVKLPMDRGEGQQWNRAPGNLFSTPVSIRFDAGGAAVQVTIDQVIPPIADPPATKYVRHERIQSERLTKFWGRPMFLGAHVLVPEGFDTHPDARYPLVINHGHFPHTIDGFRETPPDPNVKCEYSERFHLDCYNRIQEEQAFQLYKDTNAYYAEGPWARVPRPGLRNYLGHVAITLEAMNQLELVLGTRGRSGQQWDIWEAVYSPVGEDGYPKRLFDKRTGVIDRQVAEFWREHYDLSHILQRDWEKGLGKQLEGKINLYVGDMDNYYLNNAVYLVEDFLKSTKNPASGGEVAYGDRAEHCWNGDPTRPNAYSRLRYHQMFIPKIAERIRKTAPAGADLTSWKY